MYPSKFDYHRPSSVQEAVQILSSNPDAKVLAGGHSLIPVMKLRLAAPAALVDIGRIDALQGISRSNGSLRIGACVTYNDIANSADVQAAAPLLAEAAGQIGDRQVRYRGTIGGTSRMPTRLRICRLRRWRWVRHCTCREPAAAVRSAHPISLSI